MIKIFSLCLSLALVFACHAKADDLEPIALGRAEISDFKRISNDAWIIGSRSGLFRADRESDQWKVRRFASFPALAVRDLDEDDGIVAVATDSGLVLCSADCVEDDGSNNRGPLSCFEPWQCRIVSEGAVRRVDLQSEQLVFSLDREIKFGEIESRTGTGLHFSETSSIALPPRRNVTSILQHHGSQSVLLGTSRGLYVWNRTGGLRLATRRLRDEFVRSIEENDEDQAIALTTAGNFRIGLRNHRVQVHPHPHVSESLSLPENIVLGTLPSGEISAMNAWGENVALGFFNRGVCIVDSRGEAMRCISESEGLVSNRVNALTTFEDKLWVATDRGVSSIDSRFSVRSYRTGQHGLPQGHAMALHAARDSLFVGLSSGLAVFETESFRALDLPLSRVFALASDDALLYVGTGEGLFEMNLADRTLRRRLTTAEALVPDDWITAIVVRRRDAASRVLVGTYSRGLAELTRTSHRVLHSSLWVNANAMIQSEDGVCAGALGGGIYCEGRHETGGETFAAQVDVTALLEYEGDLWVATRNGLYRRHGTR